MEFNIDRLTSIFEKYSNPQKELDEQDTPAPAASTPAGTTGGGSGKTPKKWESGLARGKSNPIGNTVWASGRKFGKTYMNDPKYVWKSDRVIGKTGGSDYV